jgi:2-polyprenyl-6-methoxyphenol hydroxylase-like FAD-dependent oxidoreductase
MSGSVEIAGGGIAGLTTGLAFARKGWRVCVHEQDDDLRILGAGIYLWENGLRVLDALGVLHLVTADAIPGWRHEKRDANGEVFAASRLTPSFRLYVPPRETLLVSLYDALIAAGGKVEFGSRAISARTPRTSSILPMAERRGPIWWSRRTASIRRSATGWACCAGGMRPISSAIAS